MRSETPVSRVAVLLMLTAVALFALMDTSLKLLTEYYPPMEVAALRGMTSLPFIAVWVFSTVPARSLLQVSWGLHLGRGVLAVGMLGGFIYGLGAMPLASAYTLIFAAPLLSTVLAGAVLHERIGLRRWLSIAIGICGVLIVLRPSADGMVSWAALAVLGAATCYALFVISVRLLGERDSTQAAVFWFLALLSLGAGMLALPVWKPLRMAHAWLMFEVGLAGAMGQVALTEAFRRGPVSVLAPLEYTALLWGTVMDLLFWGVLPEPISWLGAAIIVGSGLYLLGSELR